MEISKKKYVLAIYYSLVIFIFADSFVFSGVLPTTVSRATQLLCLITIAFAYIKIKGWNNLKKMEVKWLIAIAILYTSWFIFKESWYGDIRSIAYAVTWEKNTFLAYFISIVILSLPNKKYFIPILRIFFVGASLTIPLWLLNMDTLVITNSFLGEHIGGGLPFFAGFLLSLTVCFNQKERILIWCIWGIYLLLMLLNARRNVCFSLSLHALIACAFYIYYKRKNSMLVLATCLLLGISSCFISLYWDTLTHDTFRNMNSRLFEDTRSRVERNFMKDFKKAPVKEWLFGRGIEGTYYHGTPFYDNGKLTKHRPVIETGYLNLILKSGIIYMVIIVLLILVGAFRCFQSTNRYIKYIGVFLLTYVIDLYSANPLIPYSARSTLFWFCTSIAFSKPYNQAYFGQLANILSNGKEWNDREKNSCLHE